MDKIREELRPYVRQLQECEITMEEFLAKVEALVSEAIPAKIKYSRMAVEDHDEFWLGERAGFNKCRAQIRRNLGLVEPLPKFGAGGVYESKA